MVNPELSFLSAMIYDESPYAKIYAERVSHLLFDDPRLGSAFDAIRSVVLANGSSVDRLAALHRRCPDMVAGLPIVTAMSEVYGDFVSSFVTRQVQLACKRKTGEELYYSVRDAVAKVESVLGLRLQTDNSASKFIDSLYRNSELVKTGLDNLDGITNGIERGQLVTIAGSPGLGKTAIAVTMAYQMARNGVRVLFMTLEVPPSHIRRRLAALHTGIPISSIREGLRDIPKQTVVKATEEIGAWPLEIIGAHGYNADDVAGHIEAEAHDVYIVDYIGLVSPAKRRSRETRATELGEISARIMQATKKHNVVTFSLSQMNRESIKTGNPPELWSLRDSGSIEQDSDIVLALWHNPQSPDDIIQLHVLKNRDGEANMFVPLKFHKQFSKFEDVLPNINF